MPGKKKNFYLFYFIALFVFGIGASCLHPITPTMIIERGLSNSMFGVAFAAMSIMNFFCAPLWGKLCNYFPTRRLMLIGCIGYITGQTIFGFATSDAMAIGGRMISGTFTSGVYTCFTNYIVNTTEQGPHRSRTITVNVTLQNVSGAIGYFVGGMLGTISVRFTVLVTLAILAVSAAMLRLSMVDDTPYKVRPEKAFELKDANPFEAFINAKNYLTRALVMILLSVVLLGVGQICLEQVFNFYIKDQLGMSSAYNGTFKAVVAVGSIALNSTLCLYLIQKTDIHRTFPVAVLSMVLPLGLMLVIKAPLAFSACYILFNILNNLRGSLQQNVVVAQAEPRYSNDLMGLYQSVNSFGSVIGALFAGMLYDFNPFLPFRLAFIFFSLGVAAAFIYSGRFHKKPEQNKKAL